MKIFHDGHVHTPFCPHGSKDTLEEYVLRAIELDLAGITFTEHAPLPPSFVDPTPEQDSGMQANILDEYLSSVLHLKNKYKGRFNILVGLEVDFIEGYEGETKKFLNQVGPHLDDSILSVHFLKDKEGQYHCLDFSEDVFAQMIETFESLENVYERYFQTMKRSITTDLGSYKPKRIGHLTLVTKFQQAFTPTFSYDHQVEEVLNLIKEQQLAIDYNSAGAIKPLCKETYPAERFISFCENKKIPLVYGSDAHTVKGLLQGADALKKGVTFSTPL